MTWLDLIPRWVWAALVAALAATSCKLKIENGTLSLEVEKHATHIAQLEGDIAVARADAAEQGTRFAQQARAAEQARAAREQTLVADAGRARDELDGLRADVSAATRPSLRAPATTIAPGLDVGDPFPELLLSCTERYIEMAGKADAHATDVQTLIEAWPKNGTDQSPIQTGR